MFLFLLFQIWDRWLFTIGRKNSKFDDDGGDNNFTVVTSLVDQDDKLADDDYDKDKCEVVGSPPWGLLKPAKQIHPSYTPGQT